MSKWNVKITKINGIYKLMLIKCSIALYRATAEGNLNLLNIYSYRED